MRVTIIDAIRGVAALVVVLDHGLLPKSLPIPYDQFILLALRAVLSAPAAVLVFFVVSGFCIHVPNVGRALDPWKFLVRRFIRLGIPLFAASLVAYQFDFRWFHEPFGNPVVWSLACEGAYYLLYALVLHKITERRHWVGIILASLIVAFVVAYDGREILEYPRRGFVSVTLMGLPVWLAGAYVAELVRTQNSPVVFPYFFRLLLWLVVLFGGAVAAVLKQKFHVSYGISLTVYAIFIAPWLYSCLSWRAPHVLNIFGDMSYSLYLLHEPLTIPVGALVAGLSLGLASWLTEFCVLFLIIIFSWMFYLMIERPGHKLANASYFK